jgi:competence protein ComEC
MRRPLVSILLSLCGGLVAGDSFDVGGDWPVAFAVLLASLAMFLAWRQKHPFTRFYLWLFTFFSIGMASGSQPQIESCVPPPQRVIFFGRALTGWSHYQESQRLTIETGARIAEKGNIALLKHGVVLSVGKSQHNLCPLVLPGDEIRAFAKLSFPRTRRNPGGTDRIVQLHRQGIAYMAYVRSCEDLVVVSAEHDFSLRRLAERWRAKVRTEIHGHPYSDAAKAILSALSIGDSGSLPQETRQHFQRSGLAHLLAISGLHVAFIALCMYWLLVQLLVRLPRLALSVDVRTIAACVVIPLSIFYALLAGARLPTLRATVVVICFMSAIVLRKRPDPLQTLSAAGLFILAVWPQSVFEASFQLSFAATWAVIVLAPRLAAFCGVPWGQQPKGWMKRVLFFWVQLVLVSLAATLGVAPLLLVFFNQLSWVGWIGNLVAIPLAAWVIVPLGLFGACTLLFSTATSSWFFGCGLHVSEWLCDLAEIVARTEGVSFYWLTPAWWQVALWYGLLLVMVVGSKTRKMITFGGVLFAGLLVSLGMPFGLLNCSDRLVLQVLDVGQGDAIFIKLPDGRTMLVDGGGSYTKGYDTGRNIVAPFLWSQGITKLDGVIVTHRHPDHVGGLASVVRIFRPDWLWTMAKLGEKEGCEELVQAVAAAETSVEFMKAGLRPITGDDFSVDVLWPPGFLPGLSENERSLVLRIQFGGHGFLLTGDLEQEGESGLLMRGVDLSSDVLKVGHHGSRNATSLEFLHQVRPSLAIISVGAGNSYHLPSTRVLERLASKNIEILRTDIHGAITLVSDGHQLEISREAVNFSDPSVSMGSTSPACMARY